MEGLDPSFMTNLGSGVGANLISLLAVGLFLCIKNCSNRHFKHSKCSSGCCSLELDEASESSSESADLENPEKSPRRKGKKHAKKGWSKSMQLVGENLSNPFLGSLKRIQYQRQCGQGAIWNLRNIPLWARGPRADTCLSGIGRRN